MRQLYFLLLLCTSAGLQLAASPINTTEDCTPFMVCEPNVQISLPANDCQVLLQAEWLVTSVSSSCGAVPDLVIEDYGPFGPGEYAVGVYAWLGTDYAYCTATFTVVDKTPPTLECYDVAFVTDDPDGISIGGTLFDYSDNCPDGVYYFDFDGGEGYGTFNYGVTAIDEANNMSTCSGKYAVFPLNDPYIYGSGNTTWEYIERVRLSGRTAFDNRSGDDNAYGYYVNHRASLAAGETATITLEAGYPASAYTEYWEVYLDLNDDHIFNTGDEKVYQWAGVGNHTGSFTVPAGFDVIGDHRMRVVMGYGGWPGPNPSYIYGETEDYTINISYYINWPWWGFREATEDQLTINTNQDDISTATASSTGQAVRIRPMPEERVITTPRQEATLYPNPLRLGQAPSVQLPSNHRVSQLQLSNSLGQLLVNQAVLEPGAHNLQLNAVDKIKNNGAYLLRALDDQGQLLWTKRMLVQ